MLKGFEDAFVDAQASVISLGLELLSNSGKEAEKIYIYLYRNDEMDYINFFFEKEGKLYTRDDWFSSGEIRDFFYCAPKFHNCRQSMYDNLRLLCYIHTYLQCIFLYIFH